MEICVDSLESARNAVEGGATRLEVCSALVEGGLTPSPGLIKQIKSFTTIPLYAMIRIRAGDFIYSQEEVEAMLYDMQIFKNHCHVDGFVFGALTSVDEIDIPTCMGIIAAARPLPVTFHRAFDKSRDPFLAMEVLIGLGFERILTSGHKNTALEGLQMIERLIEAFKDRIIIMPGVGITKNNIARFKEIGAKEFHASAKRKKLINSGPNSIKIGVEVLSINVTDKEFVKEMVDIINSPTIS